MLPSLKPRHLAYALLVQISALLVLNSMYDTAESDVSTVTAVETANQMQTRIKAQMQTHATDTGRRRISVPRTEALVKPAMQEGPLRKKKIIERKEKQPAFTTPAPTPPAPTPPAPTPPSLAVPVPTPENELLDPVLSKLDYSHLYKTDASLRALQDGRRAEIQRWAMFEDDGQIKQSTYNDGCKFLQSANQRVREYPFAARRIPLWEHSVKGMPRILCWVFTSLAFHHTKARAVKETWGGKCDGLLFISDLADPSLPSIVVPGIEVDSFNHLWTKMRKVIPYLHQHYGEQYDWFYKCDDDTFPLFENLRRYLLSPQITGLVASGGGLLVGRRMNTRPMHDGNHGCYYAGGGPGYLFDRVGFEKIASKISECSPEEDGHSDDLLLGCCAESIGLTVVDTRDSQGGERFHVFEPEICHSYRLPQDREKARREDWYYSQTTNPLEGSAHCSPETAAFHHLSPQMMFHTYALWYSCPTWNG